MFDDWTRPRLLVLYCVVLASVSVVLYAYTLGNPLIWDSQDWVLRDPSVRSLGNISSYFLESSSPDADLGMSPLAYYRPLVKVAYALQFALFGERPFGYHLVNVLVNALVVLGLFGLLLTLGADLRLAFVASLIWAVNPVRGEAVYWVFGLSELLMALAALATLYLYHRQRHTAALATFAIALLSRESAIVFPAVLVAYELLLGNVEDRRRYIKIAPYVAIASAYLAVRTAVVGSLPGVSGVSPLTLANTAVVIATRYAKIFLVPDAPVSLYPVELYDTVSPPVLASYGVVALAVAALVYLARRDRFLAFWFCWGGIWLLLTLNIGQFNGFLMMEKWFYLGSAGLSVVAASLLLRARAWPLLLGAVVVLHSSVVVARSTYWRDPVVYFEQAVSSAPDFPLARYGLALEYVERGEYRQATTHLERVIELVPDHSWAMNNLGNCYYALGDPARAQELWKQSLAVDPRNAYPAYNLGMLAEQAGDVPAALDYYRRYLSAVQDPPPAVIQKVAELERLVRVQE